MEIAIIILALVVLGLLLAVVYLFKRLRSPTSLSSDTEFRGRLARAVTTWALAAVGLLGGVIVVCAGINAVITSNSANGDPESKKAATTFFFTASQYVLGAVLPVVAAWVGTVLAFYFGRENYEAAAKSATALVRQLTSREKLQSKAAREVMLKMHEITYYRMPVGKGDIDVTVQVLIDEGFEKDKSKPRNRLVIVASNGFPRYVLHRSTMDAFLAAHKNPSATPPVSEKTLTLERIVSDAKCSESMKRSYFPMAETASLADAKDILDKNPMCLDLLVTQDGTENSVVIGWITNVMVLNEATM